MRPPGMHLRQLIRTDWGINEKVCCEQCRGRTKLPLRWFVKWPVRKGEGNKSNFQDFIRAMCAFNYSSQEGTYFTLLRQYGSLPLIMHSQRNAVHFINKLLKTIWHNENIQEWKKFVFPQLSAKLIDPKASSAFQTYCSMNVYSNMFICGIQTWNFYLQ